MKISPITLGFYATNNSSKKTSFGCEHCAQTMGIEDKLPRPEKYADCSNWMVPYEKRDALKMNIKAKFWKLLHLQMESWIGELLSS